jgi:hypothetical protein
VSELLLSAVVAAVAEREGVPLLVAQDLAARAVLNAALRSERRHRARFPRLEKRQSQTAILAHLIEREERTT